MVFHTEQLTTIIEELQKSNGKGYIEILLLICKLLRLCIGPIIIWCLILFLIFYVPVMISAIRYPAKNMKLFRVCIGKEDERAQYYYTFFDTNEFVNLGKKRYYLSRKIHIFTDAIGFFLLSPFLFVNNGYVLFATHLCCFGLIILDIMRFVKEPNDTHESSIKTLYETILEMEMCSRINSIIDSWSEKYDKDKIPELAEDIKKIDERLRVVY